MTAPPRITLSGYYGFGNAGDEAVLAGLVQSLRAERADVDICVLSGNPEETKRAYGVDAAHRYRPAALLRALRRTDVLLSGGGSLLQDVTSAHGIFYYLGVVRLAQIMGKKTMFAAQGIGPLNLPRSRKLTAAVANRCDALTVRDPASAELLAQIGVRRPVEVTADPALLLTPLQASARKFNAFGVALRPWPGHDDLPSVVADACGKVLPSLSALTVPMQASSDFLPSEQFASLWHQQTGADAFSDGKLPRMSPLNIFARCQIVVGMRLHALILAAACAVPSVALSYDPKVAAFMAQSGQADAVWDMTTGDADALTGLLARVWAHRQERAEALRALLPALRAAAGRTAQIALNLTE